MASVSTGPLYTTVVTARMLSSITAAPHALRYHEIEESNDIGLKDTQQLQELIAVDFLTGCIVVELSM